MLAEQTLQEEIRKKFFITLVVGDDDYYYIIALMVAYLYHEISQRMDAVRMNCWNWQKDIPLKRF